MLTGGHIVGLFTLFCSLSKEREQLFILCKELVSRRFGHQGSDASDCRDMCNKYEYKTHTHAGCLCLKHGCNDLDIPSVLYVCMIDDILLIDVWN